MSIRPYSTRDVNPDVAADYQGSFRLQCPFLRLPVLSIVFHAFLNLITLNKKHTLKDESIYPFCKCIENLYFYEAYVKIIFVLFNFHT